MRHLIAALGAAATCAAATPAEADPAGDHSHARVTITVEGATRIVQSNGLPDHTTGAFPNRGNPNRISAQNHNYRMPAQPRRAATTTALELGPFGVAVNGLPFDPGAAEWWNNDPASGWRYEAMSGAVPLGLDDNHAHVQPTGAYHYHGIPTALLVARATATTGPTLLGYAADGFPIYGPMGHRDPMDPTSELVELKSGHRLKPGNRPGGPGGPHDGSFVQDYEFAATGDLDECNGRVGVTPEHPEGTYHYVLTHDYPFIPRCWVGEPDPSFLRGPRMGPRGGGPGGQRPPRGQGNRRPPPPPPGRP